MYCYLYLQYLPLFYILYYSSDSSGSFTKAQTFTLSAQQSVLQYTTMFLLATAVALSFLGALVHAQSTNNTAIEIAAIEAHFKNADLVPSLLSTFNPTAVMTVTFSNVGAISPGQNLSIQREPLTFSRPLSSRALSETSVLLSFFQRWRPRRRSPSPPRLAAAATRSRATLRSSWPTPTSSARTSLSDRRATGSSTASP